MRITVLFPLALSLFLANGCTKDEPVETDSDSDADTDADADSDTDSDTDSDADTDTGTDSDTATTCTEDAHEPNDDRANAVASMGESGQAICNGNTDYWAFSVDSLAQVDVTVSFVDANGDLDIALEDADGTLLTDSDGTSDTESVTWVNLGADATVYLSVFGYEGAENTYDFSVVATADVCPADDVNEPNDAPAEATAGVTSGSGLVVYESASDFFAYTVPAGDAFMATVPYDETNGETVAIELRDDLDTWLDSSSYSNPETILWVNDSGTPVDVLLEVSTYDVCATYDLAVSIEVVPPEICDDSADNDYDSDIDCDDAACTTDAYCQCPVEDALEDNDAVGTAIAGPLSGTYAVFDADPDYFTYTVAAGETLTVDLTHNLGDVDLALTTPAGSEVDSSNGTDFDEHVTYTNTTTNAVVMTLEVDLWSGTCAAYTLVVTNG